MSTRFTENNCISNVFVYISDTLIKNEEKESTKI